MTLPFIKAGDIYEAARIARQKRILRHHLSGYAEPLSWNQLPALETELYEDMADEINSQLQALLLEIGYTLLTEGTERASYRIKTTPESPTNIEHGRSH